MESYARFETLVEAYLRSRAQREEDFWAWQEVRRRIETDLAQGWEVTLALLEKASNDDELDYVAAGPLEDLIDMYGDRALDLIEPVADGDKRVQFALSRVCVLFYYKEFERWYGLLCRYGLREPAGNDSRRVVDMVTSLLQSYLRDGIRVDQCGSRLMEAFDKPIKDSNAMVILQEICMEFDRFEGGRVSQASLKPRVRAALEELESLGYKSEA